MVISKYLTVAYVQKVAVCKKQSLASCKNNFKEESQFIVGHLDYQQCYFFGTCSWQTASKHWEGFHLLQYLRIELMKFPGGIYVIVTILRKEIVSKGQLVHVSFISMKLVLQKNGYYNWTMDDNVEQFREQFVSKGN